MPHSQRLERRYWSLHKYLIRTYGILEASTSHYDTSPEDIFHPNVLSIGWQKMQKHYWWLYRHINGIILSTWYSLVKSKHPAMMLEKCTKSAVHDYEISDKPQSSHFSTVNVWIRYFSPANNSQKHTHFQKLVKINPHSYFDVAMTIQVIIWGNVTYCWPYETCERQTQESKLQLW